MKTLEYNPILAQNFMSSLRGLEIDLSRLETVGNFNLRRVALSARDVKERLDADLSCEIHGTYSEAYSGER